MQGMNVRNGLRTGLTILCAAGLAACGPKQIAVAVKPPADLLTCAGEPLAPDLPVRDGTTEVDRIRDEVTLAYVLAMRAAWGDCSAKVAGVKEWADRLPD